MLDALRADERVVWCEEPPGIDALFRAFSSLPDGSHKLWTDDYLAAFAQCGGAVLATLDRRIANRYPSVSTVTIGPDLE